MILHTLHEIGRDLAQVGFDGLARLIARDDHLLEVLIENVAHDLDQQVGLAVQLRRRRDGLDLTGDVGPLRGQAVHVKGELLVGGALGGGAHDDAHVLG